MSKYTEAISSKSSHIEVIKSILKEQHLSQEARFVYEHELKEYELDLEALQIADRLEQADWGKHAVKINDLDWLKDVRDMPPSDFYIMGYEQALEDIRGDNK